MQAPVSLSMNAVMHKRYGPLQALSLRTVARPVAGHNEVLISVRAAGLHIGDCFTVRGAPFAMRLMTGLLRPKVGVPGYDVAGVIEAVGQDVTQYKVGDAVFGTCNGACADYVCAAQEHIANKPEGLSFEQAAALPTAGLAALHALRDVAKLQAGAKVLIIGASGGVGTLAVQIAKSMGAEVTGVCSSANLQMVRDLGADHVIDYTQEDFAVDGPRFDLIFDNVENRSLSDCRRALKPKGLLILNSGSGATGLRMWLRLFKPLLLSPFIGQDLRRYLSVPNSKDLFAIKTLVESGKLEAVIDRILDLDKTPQALSYIEKGHARGKVIVRV